MQVLALSEIMNFNLQNLVVTCAQSENLLISRLLAQPPWKGFQAVIKSCKTNRGKTRGRIAFVFFF